MTDSTQSSETDPRHADKPPPLWSAPPGSGGTEHSENTSAASQPLPPAGWHADIERPGGQRYWDGTAWTEHRAAPSTTPPPMAQAPAFCRACGKPIDARASLCTQCGVSQAMAHGAPMAVQTIGGKQPVLAVILSIILPGVGHLYVGDTSGLAITLLVLTCVEVFLSLTILLIPLAFIIWLPCAIWGAIDSREKAQQWNVARGLPVNGG
jgi:hypothetical protein